MLEYLTGFDMDTKRVGDKLVFYSLVVQPSLLLRVKEAQKTDLEASDLIGRFYAGTAPHGRVVCCSEASRSCQRTCARRL